MTDIMAINETVSYSDNLR